MKNFGKNSRGHNQEVRKILGAPIYGEHCAVIFAIAQFSCWCRFRRVYHATWRQQSSGTARQHTKLHVQLYLMQMANHRRRCSMVCTSYIDSPSFQ